MCNRVTSLIMSACKVQTAKLTLYKQWCKSTSRDMSYAKLQMPINTLQPVTRRQTKDVTFSGKRAACVLYLPLHQCHQNHWVTVSVSVSWPSVLKPCHSCHHVEHLTVLADFCYRSPERAVETQSHTASRYSRIHISVLRSEDLKPQTSAQLARQPTNHAVSTC